MSASSKAKVWALLAALAVGCTPADDAGEDAAPAADEEGEVPERVSEERLSNWSVALDEESADPGGFQLVVEDGGFNVQTGPAGIAWRPVDLLEEGDYTVSATFTERGAPADHREAYGIMVGGRNLEHPDHAYSYFLVRGDGSYLVKRMSGGSTSTLVDWTSSDAVQAVEAEGQESPNTLAVRVRGQDVEFVANGTVVETLPAEEVGPWGVAGIRVNHNLDVEVTDWTVEGGGAGAGSAAGGSRVEARDTASGGG